MELEAAFILIRLKQHKLSLYEHRVANLAKARAARGKTIVTTERYQKMIRTRAFNLKLREQQKTG